MFRLLRRLILVALLWQVGRTLWIAGSALWRARPMRIGNWFRSADEVHVEEYGDERHYRVERARAAEEGWAIEDEERLPTGGMIITYRRVAPPFGAAPGGEA
ncbi:MAG: hypothetical protein EXR43_02400 [Dehalococcoidia bacterium]|nr:hypothetical protein [Dehalococcoidia bacterium]